MKLQACALLAALSMAACADIPQEAVTLSVTVGKDLEVVHQSHRALAEQYFARMKADIDSFIRETYQPFLVERTLTQPRKVPRADGSQIEVSVWEVLAAEVRKPGGGKIIDRMRSTVDGITKQVEAKRAEYRKPIEDQERDVLRAIDDTYSKLQNAQAIVTGHLASVRKVKQAQQELLEKAGLKDLRQKFIDRTAGLSDQIADITARARRGEDTIDAALTKITGVLDAARSAKATSP